MAKQYIFKALSDDTRFKILELLCNKEECVCNITPHVGRKQSTVSIQLSKLEGWGIVESRREGRQIYYKIKNKKIYDMLKILKK
jgi:DNA-binding transcriptional ArsR family regulator